MWWHWAHLGPSYSWLDLQYPLTNHSQHRGFHSQMTLSDILLHLSGRGAGWTMTLSQVSWQFEKVPTYLGIARPRPPTSTHHGSMSEIDWDKLSLRCSSVLDKSHLGADHHFWVKTRFGILVESSFIWANQVWPRAILAPKNDKNKNCSK